MSQLKAWMESNPYPIGINWISGIELGIRIVNIVYTLKYLGEESLTDEEQRLLGKFIYSHGRHLYRYPSKYSSCANHAIAEALGMFVAGLCFPNLDGSDNWKKYGKEVLEREIARQIYPDGSSFEHSIPYLQFVLDHFLIYYLLCREYDEPCGNQVSHRLMAAFEFISNAVDKDGNVPLIGDDDDGYLLKLWFGKHNNFTSLLNTGAVLFEKPEWIIENAELDHKTLLLLGVDSKDKWDELKSHKKSAGSRCGLFENAGLAVIRDLAVDEVLFVGNSGPLGLKPLAGHGHADALSFWMSVAGQPIFIDPGAYLYHSGGEWRNYFRSTAAHNTIRVDSKDQATILTDFMYDDPYNIHNVLLEETDKKVIWSAGHDGYMRLNDPVMHRRRVCFHKENMKISIKDDIECGSIHQVEFFLHMHPGCELSEDGDAYHIIRNNIKVRIDVDRKWNKRLLIKGSQDPFNGWYSPQFNRLQKTSTLILTADINKTESFNTNIQIVL